MKTKYSSKWVILVMIFLFLTGCTSSYEKIDAEKAKQLIDKGAIIIDVRSEIEYEQGHIEGAIHIPHYEIDTVTYLKSTKIIVYCRSGSRSKTASDILIKMGYKHIYDLGSKDKWKESFVKKA